MFGIGVPELIIILIIGLILFGPGKLPEVGRAVGKSINELKKATSGVEEAVQKPVVPPAQAAHSIQQQASAQPVQQQAAAQQPAAPTSPVDTPQKK